MCNTRFWEQLRQSGKEGVFPFISWGFFNVQIGISRRPHQFQYNSNKTTACFITYEFCSRFFENIFQRKLSPKQWARQKGEKGKSIHFTRPLYKKSKEILQKYFNKNFIS
jgi:hypothetical protein